jgi:hypothetical protein
MTRLELTRTWTVDRAADDARAVVEQYLLDTRMRISAQDGRTITADGGSQIVTRMIGIWFVDASAYPRHVTVTITGSQVRATVEERLGFGILDRWSRANYLRAFQTWLDGLAGVLGTPAKQVTV